MQDFCLFGRWAGNFEQEGGGHGGCGGDAAIVAFEGKADALLGQRAAIDAVRAEFEHQATIKYRHGIGIERAGATDQKGMRGGGGENLVRGGCGFGIQPLARGHAGKASGKGMDRRSPGGDRAPVGPAFALGEGMIENILERLPDTLLNRMLAGGIALGVLTQSPSNGEHASMFARAGIVQGARLSPLREQGFARCRVDGRVGTAFERRLVEIDGGKHGCGQLGMSRFAIVRGAGQGNGRAGQAIARVGTGRENGEGLHRFDGRTGKDFSRHLANRGENVSRGIGHADGAAMAVFDPVSTHRMRQYRIGGHKKNPHEMLVWVDRRPWGKSRVEVRVRGCRNQISAGVRYFELTQPFMVSRSTRHQSVERSTSMQRSTQTWTSGARWPTFRE